MRALIKKYWIVFSGMLFGLVSSMLAQWNNAKIQLIYSTIILILTYIGLLKTFFQKEKKSNAELLIDKFVDSQKPIKAIEISENPTKNGEELGKIVIEQLKGGKKMLKKIKSIFKWIWLYKEQLIGVLGTALAVAVVVYAYIFDKFGWLLQYFPQTLGWEIAIKIIVGLLTIFFVSYILRNQIKKVGMGGLQYAEDYLKEVGKKLNGSLSETSQKFVSDKIAKLNEEKRVLVGEYEQVLKAFNLLVQEIKSMEELIRYNVGDTQAYQLKQQELAQVQTEVAKYEQEIAKVDQKIKDNEKVLYC